MKSHPAHAPVDGTLYVEGVPFAEGCHHMRALLAARSAPERAVNP